MPSKEWTRRKFLETGPGVVLVTSIQAAGAAVFTPAEREALSAAMDEIIPAASDMPSASQAGGLSYLERVVPTVEGLAEQFRRGLGKLDTESRKLASQPFAKLSRPERVKVLTALERDTAPDLFATLRDSVYEAYYTRPDVWQRIGYESHLTDHRGPQLKPFDESALAKVRKRGKLYREVG